MEANLSNSAQANQNRTEFTYRYVRHENVVRAIELGYIAHPEALEGTPHGRYSMLMEWPLSSEPPEI